MTLGKKVAGVYILLVLLFTGIICRIYMLSMGDSLASAAHTQSAFLLEVDRTRGIIYDSLMQPLVGGTGHKVAAVLPSPDSVTALTAAVQEKGMDLIYDTKALRPYLLRMPDGEELYSRGIELFDVKDRYGEEQLAPHLIGYLNPEQTEGTAGIELAFDKELNEHAGSLKLRYQVDALGHSLETQAPEIVNDNYQDPGGVVLTLNSDFQRAAQKAMAGVEKGAAVVMDVATGDIKAAVSMPEYDPNNLAESLKDPDSPFVNRVFSQYSVGSTFKLVTAAAALESGFGRFTPYVCNGFIDVKGQIFNCHWRTGHGQIDMKRAFEVSCNPYFINLGEIAGAKRITAMARSIGFGRAAYFTEDLVSRSGTLPTEQELENPAAVANFAFGQGSLTATPIQIAQMLSSVANGGYAVTPRLVEGFTDDGKTIYEHTTVYAKNRVFSENTSDILREYMVDNVREGSGKLAQPARGMAGGKTASAQTGIYLKPGEEDSEIVHAWFAGFYPADVPRYAIVVVAEDGKSGSDVAAPIFKKIADAIWLSEL